MKRRLQLGSGHSTPKHKLAKVLEEVESKHLYVEAKRSVHYL
jgi:hypothetical protein